jgi:hypothetical protein
MDAAAGKRSYACNTFTGHGKAHQPPLPGSPVCAFPVMLLGALLVTAALGPPSGHALISLLALNGLRVSEATGADIEQLGRSAATGR